MTMDSIDTQRASEIRLHYVCLWFAILIFAVFGHTLKFGANGETFFLASTLGDYSFFRQGYASTDMYFRPFWHFWMPFIYEIFGFNTFVYA